MIAVQPSDFFAAMLAALAEVVPESTELELQPEVSLRDQLDLDSMDLVRLAASLHARTGIDVPERDYGELLSLARAVRYLERRATADTNAAGRP